MWRWLQNWLWNNRKWMIISFLLCGGMSSFVVICIHLYVALEICIYKDEGFRLYIHNNKNCYTKSNKQSLKCLSSSKSYIMKQEWYALLCFAEFYITIVNIKSPLEDNFSVNFTLILATLFCMFVKISVKMP